MNSTSGFIDLASFSGPINDQLRGLTEGKISQSIVAQTTTNGLMRTETSSDSSFGQTITYNPANRYDRDLISGASLCFTLSEVELVNAGRFKRLRWTRNLAHNLIEYVRLTVNGSEAWRFDSISLDYIRAFRTNDDYKRLIGNIPELINPTQFDHEKGRKLPSGSVFLPLKQPHQQYFLPSPLNPHDIWNLEVKYRSFDQVLIVDDFLTGVSRPAEALDLTKLPKMNAQLMKDVSIFSKSFKPKCPDNWLFDSTQLINESLGAGTSPVFLYINSSALVHTLYFGLRNINNPADHSNYSTSYPRLMLKYSNGELVPGGIDFESQESFTPLTQIEFRPYLNSVIIPDLAGIICSYYGSTEEIKSAGDPIDKINLFYEGTQRLNADAQFFSLIHPYNVGARIPVNLGYHMYCFGPDINKANCATNFGQITNICARYDLNPGINSRDFEPFVILHTYRTTDKESSYASICVF